MEQHRVAAVKPVLADLGLVTKGDERSWAVTSPDDRYRYVLARMWERGSHRALWVYGMLNPSDARHDQEDPTVRKCVGFAKRGGAGGLLVVNMLAFSTPYPKELVAAARAGVDVRGEHNAAVLNWALGHPALLGVNIAAWGRIPPKLRSLTQPGRTQFRCARPHCFGLTADGEPRHPLMLAYSTPLVPLAEATMRQRR
jgi:hypothetical protein